MNLNNISASSPTLIQEKQTSKRDREYSSDKPNEIKKYKPVPLRLDTLPINIISYISNFLKLPDIRTLGFLSTQMRAKIEYLPVWKKLAHASKIELVGAKHFSELSKHIASNHHGALKTCASIYLEGDLAKKNFDRALDFYYRIRNDQASPADQAQTDLDIATAYLRHSCEENHLKIALQLNFRVMKNQHLPVSIRIKAGFAILRIVKYYDLTGFEDPDNIINSAFHLFDSIKTIPLPYGISDEKSFFDCIFQRDMGTPLAERFPAIVKRLQEISVSSFAPPYLQCEAKMQLVYMHIIGKTPQIPPEKAFKTALEVINNPAALPETIHLSKYLLALIAKIHPKFNVPKNLIYQTLMAISQSRYVIPAVRKHSLFEAGRIAERGEIAGVKNQQVWEIFQKVLAAKPEQRTTTIPTLYLMINMATDGRISASRDFIYEMYSEIIKFEETPADMKEKIHFCFAKQAFKYPVKQIKDKDLYNLIHRLSGCAALNVTQRYLCKYWKASMNLQGRVRFMSKKESLNMLQNLIKKPELTENLKKMIHEEIKRSENQKIYIPNHTAN